MDATEITQVLGLRPSPSADAIRQIVQVFEDGCRQAAALRRTAEELSPTEIQSKLDSIELRMLGQISTICERFERDASGRQPVNGSPSVTVAPVNPFDTLSDCLSELPRVPRN